MRGALLFAVAGALVGAVVVGSPSQAPSISVVGGDDRDRAALDAALALFESNGLVLPDLEIRFSDDTEDCAGHFGLFEKRPTPWRISICSPASFVLPHELAHAWEAAHLDDELRAAYLRERRLMSWDGPELEWRERGEEDAAFVIQQNLTTRHAPTNSTTWRERIAAYEMLTGRASPLRSDNA